MDLTELNIKTPRSKVWEWQPFVCAWNGTVLAVDQSIAASGWVFVRVVPGQKPVLMQTGMVATALTEHSGHEDTLQRGDLIAVVFDQLIEHLGPGLVVHEYPPIAGRRGAAYRMKPETNMTAAMAVRAVCALRGVPVRIVQAQAARKRLTGKATADKPEVKRVLAAHHPELGNHQPNNDNTRDAFVLALLASEMEWR